MWRFNPMNVFYFLVTEVGPLIAAGYAGFVLGTTEGCFL